MKKNIACYWNNRTVLITGHEGFLGSWLTKYIVSQGAKVIGLDIVKNRPGSVLKDLQDGFIGIQGDVSDIKLVRSIINEYKPETVFHLAAEAIVDRANQDPLRAFTSNIEGTWSLLEASRSKDFIEAIVVASSDKAYGSHKNLPYTEKTALKGSHPYDVSKSCADLISYAYFHTYNVPVCVTRCGNIFGPGDLNFSRIIPDAIVSALACKTLMVRSDGEFTRDYIYIDDIVKGYVLLAEKMRNLNLEGEAFNFSDEKPMTVLEVLEVIDKLLPNQSQYEILGKAKYEIKHQYLSSLKARSVLDWKPRFSFEKALKVTIEWYRDNLKNFYFNDSRENSSKSVIEEGDISVVSVDPL